jgi:hypothetical protein
MGLKAAIPFELAPCELYEDPVVAQKWLGSIVRIDPADFGGIDKIISASFEIEGYNQPGIVASDTSTITLVDDDDVEYGSLSFYAEAWLDYYRKEVSITLSSSATNYYLKYETGNLKFVSRSARIWIEVHDADDMRIPVFLFDGEESTGGGQETAVANDFWAYGVAAYEATDYCFGTYAGQVEKYFRRFNKVDANWQTLDHWTFTVVGHCRDDEVAGLPVRTAAVMTAALFNRTTNQMVEGSEIEFTSVIPTRKSVNLANDAANFTDGDDFVVKIKLAAEGSYAMGCLVKAQLEAVLTNASKAEIHIKAGSVIKGGWGGQAHDYTRRYVHQPSKYTDGATFYFEQTAKETGGGASLYLLDCGLKDEGLNWARTYAGGSENVAGVTWSDTANMSGFADTGPIETCAASVTLLGGESTHLNIFGFDYSEFPGTLVESVVYIVIGMASTPEMSHSSQLAMCAGQYGTIREIFPNQMVGVGFDLGAAMPSDVTLSITQSSTFPTLYFATAAIVEGSWGDDIAESQLDFSTSALERQRSAELSEALTEGNRYICHYTSYLGSGYPGNTIINHCSAAVIVFLSEASGRFWAEADGSGWAEMLEVGKVVPSDLPSGACIGVTASYDPETGQVTGEGYGSDATLWRVVIYGSTTPLDSGSGSTASFTFAGTYGVNYQLQFANGMGDYSTANCAFLFQNAAPCSVWTRRVPADFVCFTRVPEHPWTVERVC